MTNKGFTLVESLIGMMMVLAAAVLIAQVVQSASVYYGRNIDRRTQERMISNLINEMKADLSHFEVTFLTNQDPLAAFPNADLYPFYWNRRHEYMNNQNCLKINYTDSGGHCVLEGRLAYFIQPVQNLPNLFHVTIFSFHPNLHPSKDSRAVTRMDAFINKN